MPYPILPACVQKLGGALGKTVTQGSLTIRQRWTLLGGMILLGLALRLPSLNYCLAPDEAYSFDHYVRRGPEGFFFQWYQCNNQPLSSFLTWIVYRLTWEADWIMRLPALLFGLGTIAFVARMTRIMFRSEWVGLLAAFLLTVNPYHIAYSSNFRSYTAVMFFSLLSAYLLYRNLERPRWFYWLGIALATWAMAFNHIVSMIMLAGSASILGAHALAWLAVPAWRRGQNLWAFVSSSLGFTLGAVLITIAYSPVFMLPTAALERVLTGKWPYAAEGFISGAEQEHWHPFDRFAETVTSLTGAPFYLACGLALAGLLAFLRKRAWGSGVILASLMGPIAGLLIVDLKIEPRYSMTLAPFFSIALAAGFGAIGTWIYERQREVPDAARRFAALSIPTLLAAFLLWKMLPLYLRDFPHAAPRVAAVFNDRKSPVAYLHDHMAPEDVFAWHPLESSPTEHYSARWLQPAEETLATPPDVTNLWFVASARDSAVQAFPAAYDPECVATFHGAWVFRAAVEPAFKGYDLSVGRYLDPRPAPLDLNAWVLQNHRTVQGDLGIWEKEGEPPRLIDLYGEMDYEIHGTRLPVNSGRPVILRVRLKSDGDPAAIEISLRFWDEAEDRMLDIRRMRLRPNPAPMEAFKVYQLPALAPIGATAVMPVISFGPTGEAGSQICVDEVTLWVDQNPPSGPLADKLTVDEIIALATS